MNHMFCFFSVVVAAARQHVSRTVVLETSDAHYVIIGNEVMYDHDIVYSRAFRANYTYRYLFQYFVIYIFMNGGKVQQF